MNTVPNIISTKDLSYLEDMFNWHLNASKKASHFSEEVKDPSIKEALEGDSMMHAECCRRIHSILKGGQNE